MRIRFPNGETVSGEVLEIVPEEYVAFTYGYDTPGKPIRPGGSTVSIALESRRGGTLVTLRHEIPDRKTREEHVAGWRHQLALFSVAVAREQHAGLAAVLDQYFAAWNERSPEARREALSRSVTEDVEFRDAYGALFSREDLESHLGLIPVFMPGLTIKRAGEPRQCQGTALVDWVAEGPDGNVRARGTNALDLSPDGRVSRIVGFWASA